MPITTYLDDRAYTSPTSNAKLNEVLAEVRKLTGQDWRVAERLHYERRFLRRTVEKKFYELYVGLERTGSIEFQIINFYRDHDWTINTLNSAEHVVAYLYGLLGGYEGARRSAS